VAYEVRSGSYLISTEKELLDVDAVHAFLTRSYWATGIPRGIVAEAIGNSLPFGLHLDGRQIGFARVISDYATYAYVADVYVEEEFRGQGLGLMLMQAVCAHPDLQGLRRWMLGTKDAHALYRKVGFQDVASPERWMEIADPDVYTRGAA
jgi:GNAT superfamily N-acetyltransferase